MASNTRETWKKRLRRKSRAGRKRKNREARKSTLSSEELFQVMGTAAPSAK